jgi:hypothetical protein
MEHDRYTGRNSDGTFALGNPGKPKGARHQSTRLAEELLDGEAEKLTRRAIQSALDGDGTALRLCLERIVPPRRDRPVSFDLPPITTAGDASQAMGAVLEAVAAGDVTPSEAEGIAKIVEGYLRVLEASEFERRLAILEGKQFVKKS